MEEDTDGTVAAWKEARADIIDSTIAVHAGHIEDVYRALEIPCRIEPDIPTRSSPPSNRDNLVE